MIILNDHFRNLQLNLKESWLSQDDLTEMKVNVSLLSDYLQDTYSDRQREPPEVHRRHEELTNEHWA